MNALASIETGLRAIGYHADALHRGYSFADVLDPRAATRTVALAAFTQTPESFRSAAFGVVEGASDKGLDGDSTNTSLVFSLNADSQAAKSRSRRARVFLDRRERCRGLGGRCTQRAAPDRAGAALRTASAI